MTATGMSALRHRVGGNLRRHSWASTAAIHTPIPGVGRWVGRFRRAQRQLDRGHRRGASPLGRPAWRQTHSSQAPCDWNPSVPSTTPACHICRQPRSSGPGQSPPGSMKHASPSDRPGPHRERSGLPDRNANDQRNPPPHHADRSGNTPPQKSASTNLEIPPGRGAPGLNGTASKLPAAAMTPAQNLGPRLDRRCGHRGASHPPTV